MHPIFLAADRREEWLSLAERKDPTALAIFEEVGRLAECPADCGAGSDQREAAINSNLAAVCLAWLEDDSNSAQQACRRLRGLLSESTGSDLGKAANALSAVLAWDFGRGLLPPGERRLFAELLRQIAVSFLEIGSGNPHTVTNNWWMLTHGGCLLACIAADGEEGPEGIIDLSDLKQWALERFRAFLPHFGDAGLYHEGSGYIAYTLSMLMPALLAVRRHLDPDILQSFPQLRLSIHSMLVGTAAIRHTDNGSDMEVFGAALQWNDSGRGCMNLNPFIPGMAVAPLEWRGALRTAFDRLLGVGGRNNWQCSYRGLPLAVALYPFSATPEEPEVVLPKHVWDRQQGLGMWRSRWGDGAESVFGWYARNTHAGGHSQDDAGSIRLIAAGRTWICGGGQARPKAKWQSVLTHLEDGDRPSPAPLGHVSCCAMRDDGGVVAIDTRRSLAAYSERYLSWRSDTGYPFCLAVMDLLDDHMDQPRGWQWNLSFPRELYADVSMDGAGFLLSDPVRGTLTGRFLIDAPDQLEVRDMPDSVRTYSNGKRVEYPGDRYIHAVFTGRRRLRILVAMVVAGPGLRPAIAFSGNAIQIDGRPWENPFSPAVLPSVDLATSIPNRMTLPAG